MHSEKLVLPLIAAFFLAELDWYLDVFFEDVGGKIKKGIALNDKGDMEKALQVYNEVLESYPFSAWAKYEMFLTKFLMAKKRGKKGNETPDWAIWKKSIYTADPLYGRQFKSSTGEEMYETIRRMELNELFKDAEQWQGDLIKYADIANDLGKYGYAAILYWRALSYLKPEVYNNRDMLAHFLFCLENLGVGSIKDNFKGEHTANFAKIRQEKLDRMRSHIAYQAMEVKGSEDSNQGSQTNP